MEDFRQQLGSWFREQGNNKEVLLPHNLPEAFVAKLAEEATEVLKDSQLDWEACKERMPTILMVTGLLMAEEDGRFACAKEGILQRAMVYGFQINLELLKRHGLIKLGVEPTLETVFQLSEELQPQIQEERLEILKQAMNSDKTSSV